MGERIVEVVLPAKEADTLRDVVAISALGGPWRQELDGGLTSTRYLVEGDESREIVDEIQRRYCNAPGFRLLILPVSASLPQPDPEEEDTRTYGSRRGGLTREELKTEGYKMARPSQVFYATVVLSTIVVAIGLMRDNPAVIIGAMVIAPLLGPNVALALSTTLADTKLLKLGLRSNLSGIVIALAITVLLGLFAPGFEIKPGGEIDTRTSVHWSDLLLALAAGSAGALALTTGVPTALVGVMVAVALLPPTAVVGLMIGLGKWSDAGDSALLLLTNVLCVNIAAMATFRVQRIAPRTWWRAEKARKASLRALVIGTVLLVALAVLIVVTQS